MNRRILPRVVTLSAIALVAVVAAGCSSMSGAMDGMKGAMGMGKPAPAKLVDGVYVSGANGMTLYTFDRDVAGSGKSVCNGPCATNWPPLMADTSAAAMGDWTVVTRDDGTKQWAFKGKPVYFWAKDTKAGDRTGDGFNGVWKLAKP